MNCPKCQSAVRTKIGKVKAKQCYRRKECGCNYTVSSLSDTPIQRELVYDAAMGPKNLHSSILSLEKAIIAAFCRHRLLPLEIACLPRKHYSQSNTAVLLHRCLQHYGSAVCARGE